MTEQTQTADAADIGGGKWGGDGVMSTSILPQPAGAVNDPLAWAIDDALARFWYFEDIHEPWNARAAAAEYRYLLRVRACLFPEPEAVNV